jgi:putative endonuclease
VERSLYFPFPSRQPAVILQTMPEISYVYILASGFKHLYIGVTTDLEVRVQQHKNGSYPDSFTARYNIKNLVYFERFAELHSAITREKQLKR